VIGLRLAAAGLLILSTAACTPGGPNPYSTPPTQAQIAALASSMGPSHSSHVVQNPAQCAPDLADPVWWGAQLVGYSCYAPPNRGF
jgi:hypothetical protein